MQRIDYDLLTPNLSILISEYLHKMFYDVCEDAILISVLSVLSQVGSYSRLKVQSEQVQGSKKITLANFYGLTFMPSGEGKDKPPIFILGELCEDVHKEYEKKCNEYIYAQRILLEQEALEKFEKSATEREKFIDKKTPRNLIPVITDGTIEGFTDLRKSFEIAGFGGVTVRISEFGDYITSDNNARKEFMSLITEIFDNGDSKPKAIKSERILTDIKGVPCNILVHSSFHGLLDGPGNKRLMDFLNRGLARRSFICFPETDKYFEQIEDRKINPSLNIETFKSLFTEFYTSCERFGIAKLNKKAERILEEYKQNCRTHANTLNILEDEAFRAELKNRSWKALKLSGLIAKFEDPERNVVTSAHMNCAIYITEYFGAQFQRFYKERPAPDFQRLFEFMKTEDRWLTKSDIANQKYASRNNFKNWFEDNIRLTAQYAFSQGYELLTEKYAAIGMKYKVVPLAPLERKKKRIEGILEDLEGIAVTED